MYIRKNTYARYVHEHMIYRFSRIALTHNIIRRCLQLYIPTVVI